MEKPGIHHLKPAMKQTSLTKRHICITSFTCLPQMHNLNLVVEKCETNSNGKRFYERTSPYFLQGREGQIRKLPRLEESKSDMRDKYNVESWMDPGARKKKNWENKGQLGTGSVGHLTATHQQSCMVFVVVFGLCETSMAGSAVKRENGKLSVLLLQVCFA